MNAANQNQETITVFVAIFLQRWCKKSSSDRFVIILFQFLFRGCPQK